MKIPHSIMLHGKKSWYALLSIAVFLCCMEFAYTNVSGARNMQSLLAIFLIAVLGVVTQKKIRIGKMSKRGVLGVALLAMCLLHGSGVEVIRYTLLFLLIWMLNSFDIRQTEKLHKSLIVVGFVLAIYQVFALHHARANGFTATSATIFGLEITISLYYILFAKTVPPKQKVFFAALAVVTTMFTQSRSAQVIAVLLVAAYILDYFLVKNKKDIRNAYVIAGVVVCMVVLLFFSLYDLEGFFYGRSNAVASTTTRIGLITRATSSMSGLDWFFGKGGGYTVNLLMNGDNRLPLHQDIIMFLCEYGVIGTVLLYAVFMAPMKIDMIMLFVLVAGTFQNIFTSTTGMVLFTVTCIAMKQDRQESVLLRRVYKKTQKNKKNIPAVKN